MDYEYWLTFKSGLKLGFYSWDTVCEKYRLASRNHKVDILNIDGEILASNWRKEI